jgi:hypothetical protein
MGTTAGTVDQHLGMEIFTRILVYVWAMIWIRHFHDNVRWQ